jgi:2-desacetyl-2-hydroxyethyl bacteriochlorophyllide A dehydrogenase
MTVGIDTAPSLIIHEYGKVKLGEAKIKEPKPGEVLIKTEFSGVSVGTEMSGAFGKSAIWGPPPFTPGYQGVGRIISFGDPAQNKNLKVGQLVAYFTGAGTHQAFTVASIDLTHPVAETELYRYAGLFVQPAVGANALNKADIKSGDNVLVVGQGLIGQFTAALARQRGAFVAATEISKERIEISKDFCADQVFDTSDKGTWDEIRKLYPKGFDVVIESSGYLPVVEESLKCVKFEGTVVFEGYHVGEMKFDYNLAHRSQITAVFPFFIGDTPSRESIIRQITSGSLPVAPLVSHECHWRDSAEIYSQLFTPAKDTINGILIDWRDSVA